MSHFTVAIICEDLEDLQKIMATYQENNMGDCPKEFLEFYDCTKEIDQGWNDEEKQNYSTKEEFIKDYFGYEFCEEKNAYGYWENPNAKWDWYVVGGRWMGSFLIKEENYGESGRPGTFNNEIPNTPKGYRWVDYCKVSDVCWDKMVEVKKFELLEKEDEDGDLWEILTDDNHPKHREYSFWTAEYYRTKYKNKENYILLNTIFSTYAVISPDGKWNAPGEMGWFGFSSESNEDANNFTNEFYDKFIKPNMDKYIILVDCHI